MRRNEAAGGHMELQKLIGWMERSSTYRYAALDNVL